MRICDVLATGRRRLAAEPARALESAVLLCHVLGVSRSGLFAHQEAEIGEPETRAFLSLIERREQGEPIAYITGRREFWSLPLRVTPDVLIPRPETEGLVEAVLAFAPADSEWRIAELGTGCGAVALAIASERARCEIHATDISSAALAVAHANAAALGLTRVHFHLGNWLTPLAGAFHCIVSNPPYVSSTDPHLELGDCRFEPRSALSPGEDGMAAIREVALDALPALAAGGMLAFEHGFEQGADSRALLQCLGYAGVETARDLAGRERITKGFRR